MSESFRYWVSEINSCIPSLYQFVRGGHRKKKKDKVLMYLLAIRLMMMMLAEQQNLCVVIKIPGACQSYSFEKKDTAQNPLQREWGNFPFAN